MASLCCLGDQDRRWAATLLCSARSEGMQGKIPNKCLIIVGYLQKEGVGLSVSMPQGKKGVSVP